MQLCPATGHFVEPQSRWLPQLSATCPQVAPRPSQVVAGSTVHEPPPSLSPQRFGPPNPQVWPLSHEPQSTTPPHLLSVANPQSAFSSLQVDGVQLPEPPLPPDPDVPFPHWLGVSAPQT